MEALTLPSFSPACDIDGLVQLVRKLHTFQEENGFLASVLQDFQVAILPTPSRPSIPHMNLFDNPPYPGRTEGARERAG